MTRRRARRALDRIVESRSLEQLLACEPAERADVYEALREMRVPSGLWRRAAAAVARRRRVTPAYVTDRTLAVIAGVDELRRHDLYALFGVHPGASGDEIRDRWRGFAKRLHPDAGGPPDRRLFVQMHAAYTLLMNPVLRMRYDNAWRRAHGPAVAGMAAGAAEGAPAGRLARIASGGRRAAAMSGALLLAVLRLSGAAVVAGARLLWAGGAAGMGLARAGGAAGVRLARAGLDGTGTLVRRVSRRARHRHARRRMPARTVATRGALARAGRSTGADLKRVAAGVLALFVLVPRVLLGWVRGAAARVRTAVAGARAGSVRARRGLVAGLARSGFVRAAVAALLVVGVVQRLWVERRAAAPAREAALRAAPPAPAAVPRPVAPPAPAVALRPAAPPAAGQPKPPPAARDASAPADGNLMSAVVVDDEPVPPARPAAPSPPTPVRSVPALATEPTPPPPPVRTAALALEPPPAPPTPAIDLAAARACLDEFSRRYTAGEAIGIMELFAADGSANGREGVDIADAYAQKFEAFPNARLEIAGLEVEPTPQGAIVHSHYLVTADGWPEMRGRATWELVREGEAVRVARLVSRAQR